MTHIRYYVGRDSIEQPADLDAYVAALKSELTRLYPSSDVSVEASDRSGLDTNLDDEQDTIRETAHHVWDHLC